MTPEYLETMREDDKKMYAELLACIDYIVHESIEYHKKEEAKCPSFSTCTNREVEGFVENIKEHLSNPMEVAGARKMGIIGFDAMLEFVKKREIVSLRETQARVMAILRVEKENAKVN